LWQLRGCGRLQGDFEAELLELGDEPAGSSLRVFARDEVVVAEVLVDLAGAEQMLDEFDQRVGDGHRCLVRAATRAM
jgi:hypothetical protein